MIFAVVSLLDSSGANALFGGTCAKNQCSNRWLQGKLKHQNTNNWKVAEGVKLRGHFQGQCQTTHSTKGSPMPLDKKFTK
jgi:hypothetical protein